MKNKFVYLGILIVLVLAGFIVWYSYFPQSENGSWTCENGQWVGINNPKTSAPTSTCSAFTQATSTTLAGAESVSLVMQPKQCTTEPWQTWYKEGNIKYIKAPTDEQLIRSYYEQKYGITILSAQRTETNGVNCQACNVCAKSYLFTLEVSGKDVAKLVSLGWENVGEK